MTRQPDCLKTDQHVPWAWGIGSDVWSTFEAAIAGDVHRLQQLIAKEPNLVRCEYAYRTPLHFAVRENQVEAARLLLNHGAIVTYTGDRGTHHGNITMAHDRGHQQMLELLTSHQRDNFGISDEGDHIAAAFQARDIPLCEELIRQHGVHVADARGNQPLHWAVMTRQIPLIDLCIERGADINAVRPDGARPLDLSNGDYYYRGWRDSHPEAARNHWPIIGYLIARGADYCLTTACRIGDIERVREIIRDDPAAANRDALYNTWYSGFPLRSAAKAGHIDIVRLLLEHGADPNKPEHGLAPFGGSVYDSTQNGHYEVVKLLLEHGANPSQDVESSGCPLSQAQDDRTRELLRSHGGIFDPFGCVYYNEVDDFKTLCARTPRIANDPPLFAMAVENEHREIIETFLKYQPDLWSRMAARLGPNRQATVEMIRAGMDVNATNWLYQHALHKCKAEAVSHWVELGADINMIDGEHQSTPLGYAAMSGDIEKAKALIKAGANTTLAGADFASPAAWAQRRGHTAIANLL